MPEQFIQKPGGEAIKLSEAINPQTNNPYLNLQEAADIGGLLPVAAPKPTVVGVNNSVNEIDQGADDIEDQNTLLQNELNELSQGDDDGVDTTGIDIGAEFAKLQEQSANLGVTSAAELAEIESAGEAAGAGFDPLIANARERARMGQAANVVAAGRRGGFQRTRFAGQAALGPTQGDVGFAGAGGRLEATESAFKRNIDALVSQKTRAIALAKAQARTAIRTGKQQDFANAKSMLDFARQMDQDSKKAEQDMFDRLFDLKQEERAERAEDRAQTTADFNIIKELAEGETITIGDKEFTGIAKADVDPFWTSSSLVSLAKEIPVGETKTIVDPVLGEIEIQGLKTDDPNVKAVQSYDDQGNLTITSYRLNLDGTMDLISQQGAGQVGKTKTRAASTTIVLNQQEATIFGDAAKRLNETAGIGPTAENPTGDFFFNTDIFIEEREKAAATPGGDVGKFDELFAPRLNPTDPKAIPFVEASLRPEEDDLKSIIGKKLQNIDIEVK